MSPKKQLHCSRDLFVMMVRSTPPAYKVHAVIFLLSIMRVSCEEGELPFTCFVDIQDISTPPRPVCPGNPGTGFCDGDGDCGFPFCDCEAGRDFCESGINPCKDSSLFLCQNEQEAAKLCLEENTCLFRRSLHQEISDDDFDYCFSPNFLFCQDVDFCPSCFDAITNLELCNRQSVLNDGIFEDCPLPPIEECEDFKLPCSDENQAAVFCYEENSCWSRGHRNLADIGPGNDIGCYLTNAFLCSSLEECPACSNETLNAEICYRKGDFTCDLPTDAEACEAFPPPCEGEEEAEMLCFVENSCLPGGIRNLEDGGSIVSIGSTDDMFGFCDVLDSEFCSFAGFCPPCFDKTANKEACWREFASFNECPVPTVETCEETPTILPPLTGNFCQTEYEEQEQCITDNFCIGQRKLPHDLGPEVLCSVHVSGVCSFIENCPSCETQIRALAQCEVSECIIPPSDECFNCSEESDRYQDCIFSNCYLLDQPHEETICDQFCAEVEVCPACKSESLDFFQCHFVSFAEEGCGLNECNDEVSHMDSPAPDPTFAPLEEPSKKGKKKAGKGKKSSQKGGSYFSG